MFSVVSVEIDYFDSFRNNTNEDIEVPQSLRKECEGLIRVINRIIDAMTVLNII